MYYSMENRVGLMMQGKRQWLSWVVVISLGCSALTVSGCKQLTQVGIGTQAIDQVLNSSSNESEEMTVRGEVISQVSILKQGAYLLKDGSGLLWVFTEKPLPAVKSTVTVRGKPQKGVVFASINADVILAEEERL